jgi:hypothetical protein
MNHRELFDATAAAYCKAAPGMTFTDWLINHHSAGKALLTKLDFLDRTEGDYPEVAVGRAPVPTFDVVQEKVEALSTSIHTLGELIDEAVSTVNQALALPHEVPRSILVQVIEDHGATWSFDSHGNKEWVCNCAWEGESHADHIVDMYEAALKQ